MKQLLTLLVCVGGLMVLSSTSAQEAPKSPPRTIAAAQAEDYIGSTCVVTGKVAEVYANDKLVRLNFDKGFPKQSFTAVVFAAKTNLFPDLKKMEGKEVAVTGKITEYREKPQIVLTSTNQLQMIDRKE